MEQRRLRLGDILDDYCPRERRVTNHAVVAMIEEDVKQTRCTTCDAEHVYKGGKEPRRRKKDAGTVLYEEVLAGMPETSETVVPAPAPEPVVAELSAGPNGSGEPPDAPLVEEPEAPAADEPRDEKVDDGPFHRRLIRATLPRPEGQKEVRQIPDFTVRHNGSRGGNGHNLFRGGSKMRGPGGGNPHRPQGAGGPRRFGPSTGSGRGPSTGNPGMRGARGPSAGPGRGRKRSR